MTRRNLATARYYWRNDSVCRRCGQAVRFYATPDGVRVLNPMPKDDSPVVEHRMACKGDKARD
jgi:hypothetical protein